MSNNSKLYDLANISYLDLFGHFEFDGEVYYFYFGMKIPLLSKFGSQFKWFVEVEVF